MYGDLSSSQVIQPASREGCGGEGFGDKPCGVRARTATAVIGAFRQDRSPAFQGQMCFAPARTVTAGIGESLDDYWALFERCLLIRRRVLVGCPRDLSFFTKHLSDALD